MQKEHHHHLLEQMHAKGWNEQELLHAKEVFEQRKEHFALNKLESLVHLLFFAIIIFGNFVVAATIVPLLVLFPNAGLYAMLIILGVSFGFLTEIVLKHIDHRLGIHHHIAMGIIIPIIAAITVAFIVTYAQEQLPNLFNVNRSPVILGVIYAISFVLPYFLNKLVNFWFG